MFPIVLWVCIFLKQKLALLYISGPFLTLVTKYHVFKGCPLLSRASPPRPPIAARTHAVLFPVLSPREGPLGLHTTSPDTAVNILAHEPLWSWVHERSPELYTLEGDWLQ